MPPPEGVGTRIWAVQLRQAKASLKALVPDAGEANVRLALHPNDPPVAVIRVVQNWFAEFRDRQ